MFKKDLKIDFEINLEMIEFVQEELIKYDNAKPKLDELKFIQSIADKYNLTFKQSIKLIQYVRKQNRR